MPSQDPVTGRLAPGDGVYVNRITKNGRVIEYLRISRGPQRFKYVHQLVAEAILGRELLPNEEVDHLDRNTLNNRWDNIVVRDKVTHSQVTASRNLRDPATGRYLRTPREGEELEEAPF